jgi:hypothetical protein
MMAGVAAGRLVSIETCVRFCIPELTWVHFGSPHGNKCRNAGSRVAH